MNSIKKYLKCIGVTFGLVLVFGLFLTNLNFFDLVSNNIYKVIMILFTIISIFTGSYILGSKTDKKGYIEGLKFGIIIIFLFFVISFLAFDKGINLSSLLYYLIILGISSSGSMVGINRRKSK